MRSETFLSDFLGRVKVRKTFFFANNLCAYPEADFSKHIYQLLVFLLSSSAYLWKNLEQQLKASLPICHPESVEVRREKKLFLFGLKRVSPTDRPSDVIFYDRTFRSLPEMRSSALTFWVCRRSNTHTWTGNVR